jgi:hypothetical protein
LRHAGTRCDYLYRPALPYGTGVISMATGYELAKAHHAYTALFYWVGIAGVYLLVRIGMGSRGAAWLAAGVTALLLPSYPAAQRFPGRWNRPSRLSRSAAAAGRRLRRIRW